MCFKLVGNCTDKIEFKYLARERDKKRKRRFCKRNSVWALLFELEVIVTEFCSVFSDLDVF